MTKLVLYNVPQKRATWTVCN